MNKELQSRTWTSLPKEARKWLRKEYRAMLNKQWWDSAYLRGRLRIMRDIYGEHNLTSDTEPEEMLMAKASEVRALYKNSQLFKEYKETEPTGEFIESWLIKLFGDKYLPDEEESVQGEPKYPIGSIVRITNKKNPYQGHKGKFGKVRIYDAKFNRYAIDGIPSEWEEGDLEPYTEPESRNLLKSMSNCDKPEYNQLKDNMEEKELNLCELLKDCKGEDIFSTFEGNMTITKVTDSNIVLHGHNTDLHCGNGFYPSGICQLYPSRALYEKYPLDAKKAWMEWSQERKPKRWTPKDGVQYWYINNLFNCVSTIFDEEEPEDRAKVIAGNCFTTQESCAQAADAVRETLMKFYENHKDQ